MAIGAAKEFGQDTEPDAQAQEEPSFHSVHDDLVRRQRAAEMAGINRLAQQPRIQREFDELFPNIANNPSSQANFDHMIADGPFDPETVGAFQILREARVVKPHLVDVFNASEQPKKQSSTETPLHPDPSTFIG